MTPPSISDKAAFARAALLRLERIPQGSLDEFAADFRNLDAALYAMQTCIQALLDIGSLVIALQGLRAPRSSLDVLERLEEAGALPPGSAQRFRPLVGFRNRVVHLYDRIDPAIVYRILREERDDMKELLGMLLDAVDAA